jgi:DNA replication protein DnaC
MLFEQTMTKLQDMKLFGIAEGLEEQRRQSNLGGMSFEDRLALLVDRQWIWKEDRALRTRLQYAKLKQQVCIEDIDYRHPRGLQRSVIEQLSRSDWIKYHQHCIITGPTGVGKTFLACALAQKVCRDGYRSRYFYAPKLFRELAMAHADGSYARLLNRLTKINLLVIDDWGMEKLKDSQYRDLLEILDDRQGSGSVMITSQLPVNSWHDLIANPTTADAILDRIVHHAHHIELKGESMRKLHNERPRSGTTGKDQNTRKRRQSSDNKVKKKGRS